MPVDIMEIKPITFPLPPNSKVPRLKEWNKLKRSIPTKNQNQNIACLTGKKTGFFVLDLDLYKQFKGLISVDLEHPFYKILISNDYIKYLSEYTQTVRTPSGGFHFYFKYNNNFPRCSQNSIYNYDIRSNGGYVVYPNSKIDNNYYTWITRGKIEKIPDELEKFLIDTYSISNEEKEYDINDDEFIYKIGIPELKYIYSKIPIHYLENYYKWLTITTLTKKIYDKSPKEIQPEILKIWDDWGQLNLNNYHYQDNIKYFNNVNPKSFDLSLLFSITKIKPFGFFKGVKEFQEPENKIEISKNKLGYNFITEKNNKFYLDGQELNSKKLIIKSDTGTGKTTSFYHFIKQSKNKFISLVSRQLLGYEQKETIKKMGIDSKFYLFEDYNYGDNIIICADSLINLDDFDFSDYVCFIDEFNSVIEYIETSSTHLKNLRKPLIKLVEKMIKECKFFVGVDADISEVSYDYMLNIGDFIYIKNDYQHFKGKNFYIFRSETEFIEKLKKEKKFLLCSDSATIIENLNVDINFTKIIGKNKNGEITDDNQEEIENKNFKFIHLDSQDKIGFSPKIIYGQDSIINRPVYAWFNGRTISPPQMVQQIARCRNPTEINIYFKDVSSYFPMYNNIKETEEDIINTMDIYKCEYPSSNELYNDIFYRLLEKILYRNDSYKTSKYLHCFNILCSRGFNFRGFIGKTDTIKFTTQKEKVKEIYETNYLNHLKNENLPDYINSVNKFLNIPKEELKHYSKLFIDDYFLQEHLTISKIFTKDVDKLEKKLLKMDEYIYNKMKSDNSKIKFLFKLMDVLKIDINNISKTNYEDTLKYNPSELEKQYKAVIRTNVKNLKFENPYNLYVKFGVLFRSLTGIITSKKEKHKVVYNINNDLLTYHKKIMDFRKSEELNYDFID